MVQPTKNIYGNGIVSFLLHKDLGDALACSQDDVQKKAYITSLGLGPREKVVPSVEKIDQGYVWPFSSTIKRLSQDFPNITI